MKRTWNLIVAGSTMFALSAYSAAAFAGKTTEATTNPAGPVVVTGTKVASDQELKKRVQFALNSDPYVYAEHVSVTSKDGVVTLDGLVADEWDLLGAVRISSGVAGVRRVNDQLEIWDLGQSGY